MTALVHRARTPVCYQHAPSLADMDPCYGVHPITDAGFCLPAGYVPPPVETLANMELELVGALVPCGMVAAAKAAAVLIAAYPQADHTSAAYAQHVAKRLAECPADLLDHVVDRIIDGSPDFRPAPGRVADAVRHEVAKRSLLLRRVQAAQRWWAQTLRAKAEAEDIAAQRQAAQRRLREVKDALQIPLPPPASSVINMEGKGQLRIGPRPNLLTPDELAAARARLPVPPSAIPPTADPQEG